MSGLVRARVRGFEKNMSRALAESDPNIEILEGKPTHREDGQPFPTVRVETADEPESTDPPPVPYARRKKPELEQLVAARNDAAGEGEPQIEVGGSGTIADLAAALDADDARRAEVLANSPSQSGADAGTTLEVTK